MLIHYKVKFYEDYEHTIKDDSGITEGKSLANAVKKITNWYGEKDIIELTINQCEDILDAYELTAIVKESESKEKE